ncbi:hypothetical protein MTR67_002112 [Solanum verrucosum]|uniref:Uncharacterized protein n=1 Tax=Solanum verrucosum TaxID=315347 RepID=A0AAF0PPX4_SOLVR|nr:hypothetical protein MTR67_002112 [Solanum verrucosum]
MGLSPMVKFPEPRWFRHWFRLLRMHIQGIKDMVASLVSSHLRGAVLFERTEADTSDVIMTSTIFVSHQLSHALSVLGSTFSYMFACYTIRLDLSCESMSIPMRVATPIGDSLVVDRVYRAYMVSTLGSDTPTLESILVFREFVHVFSIDLPSLPPDHDINLGLMFSWAQPLSIPSYLMAPAELRELKEQLQDLLGKIFIKQGVSPWCSFLIHEQESWNLAELGTQVELSVAFHPQTDCQSERTVEVSPTKGVMRFERKGNLRPRFISPFEILRQYVLDESHVLQWGSVELDETLSFEEELVAILDRQVSGSLALQTLDHLGKFVVGDQWVT